MAFSITEIQSNLRGGGARPSLFQVQVTNPVDGRGALTQPFMILAASIPASVVGAIPVPYYGRTINVAGVRSYAPWSVQVLNDEAWDVRAGFESWVAQINLPISNIRGGAAGSNPSSYKGMGQVFQYGQTGEVIKTYDFSGMFPINVGQIQLSWSAGNQIELFPVTFALDYFTIAGEAT